MVTNVNMNQAVNAYNSVGKMATQAVNLTPEADNTQGPSFSALIEKVIGTGISNTYKSEAVSTKALAGKADLNDLVQAVANAELTVQTMVAVRDRVISAYQDIIRMPI